MADDKLNLEVEISAHTKGLAGTERDISLINDAVESLNRQVGLVPEAMASFSQANARAAASARKASGDVREETSAFKEMQAEVAKTQKRLRSLAQESVVSGGRNPVGLAADELSISQAEKILAINEAANLSAVQAANKRLSIASQEDRALDALISAEKQLEDSKRESLRADMSSLDAAKDRLAVAQQELRASQTEKGKLAGGGDSADQIQKRAENLVREARARDEVRKATAQVNAETGKLAEANRKAAAEARALSEAQKAIRGGRDYSNLSVNIDAGIEARKREASAWSDVVKARMNDSVAAEKQAESTDKATTAVKQQTTSLPTLRYALHDVSNQLFVIGGAMTAFSVSAYKAAVDYQRAFADVIRTNDGLMSSQVAANRMFEEFVTLASEIPTTFAELSEIGALAGQLGIATSKLASFTESVAMFSATTGESIDSTATAFGRLDALLPDVEGDFEALGSSILNVGINSVATEGEIIKITTQLAGIGSQAGLTYDELVGLSGALASVGVQPELARGTITRLFGQISRAVTLGGESLDGFGKIAGTTGDEFASKWNSNAMGATVDFLRGIETRGSEAEAALRAVGITSVRDVPAILRLAQTVDSVLVPALGDAADGANDASQLSENYGVIAETVASKLQILANNFKSLMAEMGNSVGPLSWLIDNLNGVLKWARDMAKDPVASFMLQLSVAIGAVSGGSLILLAGLTRVGAGMLAFRTAMIQSGVAATGLRGQLLALIGSISGVDAASLKASGSVGKLSSGMRLAGGAAAAMAVGATLNWLDNLVAKARGAVVDVDTLTQSLSRLDGEMSTALSKDISSVIDKSITSIGASAQGASFWESTNIFSSTEGTWRRVMNIAETEYDAGLARMGQKTSSWFTTNPWNDGAPTWFAGIFDSSIEELDQFEEAWIQAWETASSETQKQALVESLEALEAQVISAGGSSEGFRYNFADLFDVMGQGVDETALLKEQVQATNDEFEAMQDTLMGIIDDVFSTVNAQYALSDAMSTLGGDYITLGAAAAFSGDSMQSAIKTIVEQSGSAGSAAANLQVLYDFILANSSATAGELIHLANAIDLLRAEAGGTASSPTLQLPDFNAFADGVEQARASLTRAGSAGRTAGRDIASGAKEAQKEVRTLKDYASDLAAVWDRAFEIRFSGQQTIDKVRDSIQKLRDAAKESDKRIRDIRTSLRSLRADAKTLKSDISILEYWLGVAREYGDTKRATAIEAELAEKRAELGKKTDEITDKTKELKKEQNSQNKTLKGNSQVARDNRKEITNLVSEYQDHLEALANSGASQDTLRDKTDKLREDFYKQGEALGYSRKELEPYAKGFDDVRTAINKVPRKLTVKINSNPAITALNEIKAAADKASSAVRNVGSGGTGGGISGGGGGGGRPEKPKEEPKKIPYAPLNRGKDLVNHINNEIRSGRTTIEDAAKDLGISVSKALNLGITRDGIPKDQFSKFIKGTQPQSDKAAAGIGSGIGRTASKSAGDASKRGFNAQMPKALSYSKNPLLRTGGKLGASIGSTLSSDSGSRVKSRFGSQVSSGMNSGRKSLQNRGDALGKSAGSSFTAAARDRTKSNFGSRMRAGMNAGQATISSKALSLGDTVGRLFRSGLTGFLDLTLRKGSKARKTAKEILGFQSGGFTGRGREDEIAGLVHAGEYVVPKKDVNQATGLPYADALGRLMTGVKGNYAPPSSTGSGSGMNAPVALTPGTIQAIAQATGKVVYLNGQKIADSTSSTYRANNIAGGN